MSCPYCGNERTYLIGPHYGFYAGPIFTCYSGVCNGRSYIDNSPEAMRINDESRAASAANAKAYAGGQGGEDEVSNA